MAYSIIALQELNLNYKWNRLYWVVGNLEVDSGAYNTESNEGSNYNKIGQAVSRIQREGIVIANPDINTAEFGFVPDEENNRIIFSLKGINGINTEVAQTIIKNRPYTDFDDFCKRMIDTKIIKNSQMLMLIKAGCFLELDSKDRAETMKKYLTRYKFKSVDKLTLAQIGSIQEYNIIPDNLQIYIRYINFKKYILDDEGLYEKYIDSNKKPTKIGYHDRYYILDNDSQPFFEDHFSDASVVKIQNGFYVISEKKFCKEYDIKLQPLKDWFISEDAVKAYNTTMFNSIWNEFASGNESSWSMQALTCYDNEHELINVNEKEYGIVDFNTLSEEPKVYETYTKRINNEYKELPKYEINRLAGTVVSNDNFHYTIGLLTVHGLVTIKFYKESYSHYNRRISVPDGKGGKTVIEEPWFKRGTLLIISGIRRDDLFMPRIYNDTVFKHTVCKILSVNPDGSLELQQERTKV